MLDDAHASALVDEPTATAAFAAALRHELAFWDVPDPTA
jgi:hypothetical protein